MSQLPGEPTNKLGRRLGGGFRLPFALTAALLFLGLYNLILVAGRRQRPTTGGVLLNHREPADNSSANITSKNVSLYDNGVEQTIRNFSLILRPPDRLLVDNSVTLRADVEKLEQATREFAYEIFEGDQLWIVGLTKRRR